MKIEVQKVPKKVSNVPTAKANLIAFCHEFPQYKYDEAKKMPYKHVLTMLKIAQRRRADFYLNLLDLVNAAQDGKATKKLRSHYEVLADG